MKTQLLSVLALISFFVGFSQSAWVQPKGAVYTQLSYNDISNYDRVFNKEGGDIYPSRVMSDRTVQWYTEYGISDKVSLVAIVPFKMLKTGDAIAERSFPLTIQRGNFTGLGNLGLAGRYKLPIKNHNVTAQFQVDFNTVSKDQATGLQTGRDAYTFTPTIAYGKGSAKRYFQAHTGLFFRTNGYSNGWRLYGEGGMKFFNQLWVVAFVDIVESFQDGNRVASSEQLQTALFLNNNEYGGFGIKLIEELTKDFGVTAAVGGAFYAHLEAHKASLNFGVYYKIKPKNK